jgi:hypothetical protein
VFVPPFKEKANKPNVPEAPAATVPVSSQAVPKPPAGVKATVISVEASPTFWI